jgi:hypothetical protein
MIPYFSIFRSNVFLVGDQFSHGIDNLKVLKVLIDEIKMFLGLWASGSPGLDT